MPSFAPEYVDLVLNDIFEDAKRLFLVQLRAIDYAHLVMLAEQGIVARDAARLIRAGLDRIDEDQVRTVAWSRSSSTPAATRSRAGSTPRAAATTST
jgi:argininosuccinate lyase